MKANFIPKIKYTENNNFFLMAGPCVIEDEEMAFPIAEKITELSHKYQIPYIFKASYKKANRSRIDSFTGIGDLKALKILKAVSERFDIPVVTDIHTAEEAGIAAEFVDILQIPAFLCRQTELLIAAGKTGKTINIKKGQFLSGEAMKFAADKVLSTGNNKILLTERGNMYGYGDLIVDFRNIPVMQKTGFPVILDTTHSLQQPNRTEGVTGGHPELIETIAKAGIAAGADGIFLETHPEPSKALSDGANMLRLNLLDDLLYKLTEIKKALK